MFHKMLSAILLSGLLSFLIFYRPFWTILESIRGDEWTIFEYLCCLFSLGAFMAVIVAGISAIVTYAIHSWSK